jgi:hypothetical protein
MVSSKNKIEYNSDISDDDNDEQIAEEVIKTMKEVEALPEEQKNISVSAYGRGDGSFGKAQKKPRPPKTAKQMEVVQKMRAKLMEKRAADAKLKEEAKLKAKIKKKINSKVNNKLQLALNKLAESDDESEEESIDETPTKRATPVQRRSVNKNSTKEIIQAQRPEREKVNEVKPKSNTITFY